MSFSIRTHSITTGQLGFVCFAIGSRSLGMVICKCQNGSILSFISLVGLKSVHCMGVDRMIAVLLQAPYSYVNMPKSDL